MGSSLSAIRDREEQEEQEMIESEGRRKIKELDPYLYALSTIKINELLIKMQDHYVGQTGKRILDEIRIELNKIRA